MGDRIIPASKAGGAPHSSYRGDVVRLMSLYPDGIPGAALLLMRLSYASLPFSILPWLELAAFSWWVAAIAAGLISLALAGGLATRAAALLLMFGLVAAMSVLPQQLAPLMLAHAGGAGALLLLGPGAFSIDARVFGRRVIRVVPRSPDQGSDA